MTNGEDRLPRPRAERLVIGVLIFAACLIIAYWLVWFFVDRSLLATESRAAYYEHEQSFVLADGWLALCCVMGAVTLARRSAAALFWIIAGGAAGLYLGCMDGLYDVSRNDWFGAGVSGYIELGIVVLTWVLGISLMVWAWRNRKTILGPA
jgi:hypothetical protein